MSAQRAGQPTTSLSASSHAAAALPDGIEARTATLNVHHAQSGRHVGHRYAKNAMTGEVCLQLVNRD